MACLGVVGADSIRQQHYLALATSPIRHIAASRSRGHTGKADVAQGAVVGELHDFKLNSSDITSSISA
jgi:hypothetical protein